MGKALTDDAGLMISYQANIQMLLFDKYQLHDAEICNRAARDILGLIFSIPPDQPATE